MNVPLKDFKARFDKYIAGIANCGEVRDCFECPGEAYHDAKGGDVCANELRRLIRQFSDAMECLDAAGIEIDLSEKRVNWEEKE